MDKYKNIKSEHQLRSLVFDDYFKSKDISWEQEIEKIDFIITEKQSRKGKEGGSEKHYLWAETKKSETEQYIMLTQLLLTIKKPYDKNEYIIPNYVGCFDTVKIIFVPTSLILNILHDSDIKWNITPSDTKDEYFLKIISKLKYVLFNNKEVRIFNFGTQDEEIKKFIKNNILKGDIENKFEITEDNFDRVYLKWLEKVKPSIAANWEEEKKIGLYDADFYLADLLSRDDTSIKERLLIVLQNDHYKLIKAIKKSKLLLEDDEYFFKDKQKAYNEFWSIYQRPPLPDYWDNILNRKDLLVPQDIRERKGAFFTPSIWVNLSQKYIADVFGNNWQDDYYVWDCCAGTGNLLVGINKKIENVFASTIDEGDVKIMHDLIENGAKLSKKNVFKFDFLNDDFKKLPKTLKDIIDDPKKREKLIVYINPPYAEATSSSTISGSGKNKSGVSIKNKTYDKYQSFLGKSVNEIFTLFIARIYKEIPNCKLCFFSKAKFINSQNFSDFREFFKAEYKKGFVVRSDTFDNVKFRFPIIFSIWDNNGKKFPKNVRFKIIDNDKYKTFHSSTGLSINKWIKNYDLYKKNAIGFVCNPSPDFLRNNQPYITVKEGTRHFNYFGFSKENIIEGCIYFSVRLCIEPTWLEDRDQFVFPNSEWQNDIEFQNDCFVFTLFHGQNQITSVDGDNHWIPFTEEELEISGKLKSHFISDFIAGKIEVNKENGLFEGNVNRKKGKLKFSKEAQDVFNAGLKLWKYYHSKPRVNINASFYDIRLYFQGEKNGRMNNKSNDEEYNTLIGNLRDKMKILAKKIEPKVYEYGFLLK